MPAPLRFKVWSWFCQKMLLEISAMIGELAVTFANNPKLLNANVLLRILANRPAPNTVDPLMSLIRIPVAFPIRPLLRIRGVVAKAPEVSTAIPKPASTK